jgi:hypothetical protein
MVPTLPDGTTVFTSGTASISWSTAPVAMPVIGLRRLACSVVLGWPESAAPPGSIALGAPGATDGAAAARAPATGRTAASVTEEAEELTFLSNEPGSDAASALAPGADRVSQAVAAAPAKSKGRSARHDKRFMCNTPRLLEKSTIAYSLGTTKSGSPEV